MKAKGKSRLATVWREWVRPILIIFIVLGSFRSAVADWNDVPTGSMKPTIIEGDRIFVNKLAYGLRLPFTRWRLAEWDGPRRGDVVILFAPDTGIRLVKRVIGVPGDRVEVRHNVVIINGEPAAYGPLARDVIEVIETDEQPQHRFASEQLDGPSHPVMLTPNRPSPREFGPIDVAEGAYFVLGDNRDNSRDSRWFGCVGRSAIVGRVTGVVLSLDPDNWYMPRWHRFLRSLP